MEGSPEALTSVQNKKRSTPADEHTKLKNGGLTRAPHKYEMQRAHKAQKGGSPELLTKEEAIGHGTGGRRSQGEYQRVKEDEKSAPPPSRLSGDKAPENLIKHRNGTNHASRADEPLAGPKCSTFIYISRKGDKGTPDEKQQKRVVVPKPAAKVICGERIATNRTTTTKTNKESEKGEKEEKKEVGRRVAERRNQCYWTFRDVEESMEIFSGDDNRSIREWVQEFEELAELSVDRGVKSRVLEEIATRFGEDFCTVFQQCGAVEAGGSRSQRNSRK
ncbi:UNVERIFIED_CONTAM: hypothetical protein PYX00_005244 [Menopon gallinae]|uniref:PH domain-containing protein n=1 Tax=Menopon gallinae TaxID=328185 RepID=A0AAW2HQI3_9NEOP